MPPEQHERIQRVLAERRPSPAHVFFAVFLSSFAESGMLNQGVMNFLAKNAAEKLHAYLKAIGLRAEGETPAERLSSLVKELNKILDIGEEVVVREEDGVVVVGIGGEKCKYCPKGVGLAEIPGTACPFPRLIEALARLEGVNAELVVERRNGRVSVIEKKEGLCHIRYKLEG